MFGNDKKARSTQSALEQAQAPQESGFVGGKAMAMVEKLLDVGIDGRGPFDSATEVAAKALAKEPDPERAVDAIVKSHLKLAMANGFVTSLGGFITMPVALPANVTGFYLLATRMVAAVAKATGAGDTIFCIGVDTDQWDTVPAAQKCLITSATKELTKSVTDTLAIAKKGDFEGLTTMGSAGLAPFHDFDSKIPADVKTKVEKVVSDLKSGALTTGVTV